MRNFLAFLALVVLASTSCVLCHSVDVEWGFSSSETSLKVGKGYKITFTWTGFHDLYLLKKPCDFSEDSVVLAPAANGGSYTWDTENVPAGQYYVGCSIGSHCTNGMSMSIRVCAGSCKKKRRNRG